MFSIRIFVVAILLGLLSVDTVAGRSRNDSPQSQETDESDYEVEPEYHHRIKNHGDTITNSEHVYKRLSHHSGRKRTHGKRWHRKGPSFRTRRKFTSSLTEQLKSVNPPVYHSSEETAEKTSEETSEKTSEESSEETTTKKPKPGKKPGGGYGIKWTNLWTILTGG